MDAVHFPPLSNTRNIWLMSVPHQLQLSFNSLHNNSFFFLSWAPSVAENLPLWHIQNVLLKIKVIVFCFLMQMASHMACKCIWRPEDEEHVMIRMQLAAQTCTETLNRNEGGGIKTSPWPLVYLSVFLSIKKSRQSSVSGRRACVFSAGFLKLDHMLLLIIKLYGLGILYSFLEWKDAVFIWT